MSEETLFTAARRALRNFDIDMQKGGIITVETMQSMETLWRQVETEKRRIARTVTIKSEDPLAEQAERNSSL